MFQMSLLDIRIYPDPVLKKTSTPVTSFDRELSTLIDNMFETMYESGGIGLAAPQVGELKRVVVIDTSRKCTEPMELINPEIISRSGESTTEEGCLSIPEYRESITRSSDLTLKALDRKGKQIELEAKELLAICIQHEIDHLDGILIIDRISRLKRELFKSWFKKRLKE